MQEQPQNSRVLVVDDHVPAAEMVKRLFSIRGYDVECAFSGQEAVEIASQFVPDLILLDVMMPGMDGFETLEQLRANTHTSRIPVIFITAKDEPEDIEQGLQLGADDYIPKPVEPRELVARAKAKIEARKLRDALEQRTADLDALLRFTEELNNQHNVEDLLNLILFLVLDLIPCQVATIIRREEEEESSYIPLLAQKEPAIDVRFKHKQFLEQYVCNQNFALQWTAEDDLPFINLRCGMAIVLQHGDSEQGVLALFGDEPFKDNHLQVFEAIGRQSALALRNAQLYAIQARYAAHLEDMVEERTAELRSAQDLLIRAEKLASVGRLSSGIAHEINNPLLPIRVNLELMAEDIAEGNLVSLRDIEETLHSVNRISRIVERLQQFTRKRGQGAPLMESLSIGQILDDVIALSRTYISRNGVEIEVDIAPNIPVYANRDQLEQVFLNLILNAKAAMEYGGTLTIQGKVENDALVISFSDTGTGIPKDMIDTIFEPFVSTKEDGSGLVLFISYGIIQDHSGTMTVESEMGKGTTFTITLPINHS